ncbi:hypothetical protein N799_13905 [Lysobacter arseniciresistens ZS79]|uniref:Uncharacterized protein n=1 Tax=Lysobacter arseniciresistens ZS79 TaxID=913325 RepID=A0A0A0F408_9GAMM|nr:hypothetical protein [Lysobacter arseniciresistens]KGM57098.1 hypothetical protein N799_13905 [Lysobacter arseniciresistens ZS79]
MFGYRAAKYWAAVGALFAVGTWLSLSNNVLVALAFAGLTAACLLVAASCLLVPPRPPHREDDGHDHTDAAPRRRNWRP